MMPTPDNLPASAQPRQFMKSTWISPELWEQHEDYIRGLYDGGATAERMSAVLAAERDFRPSPGQLTRQLAIWRTGRHSTRMQHPVRLYSDKEALTSPKVVPATTTKADVRPPSSTAHRQSLSGYSTDSPGDRLPGCVPYGSASGYQPHGGAISRAGTDDERNETKSILSWTVDTRSETTSVHTSRRSVLSFPASQHGVSEDTIREILLGELNSARPRLDSYLRLARDTLGIHNVETWTSDRLLEFAILLSKGGLASFGASLYHYLLCKECENVHGQQFLVRLLVRCLISGQKDISWSRLGRVTYRVIEYLKRDNAESGSLQLAQVLAACLLCSPTQIDERLRCSLLAMACQAMDADNWKALMRKDTVDLKDLLDLEFRILNSKYADQNTSDSLARPPGSIWQKGSFRVHLTNSGSLRIKQIVEWALLKAEGSEFYRRTEEYSKRGKSKQMFQATYLSLITRLVHEAGTYQGASDIHLTVNVRNTTFKLNEYESMAIISLLLVNIKTTMSLISRYDSDEYLSLAAVNTFFSNPQLLEDTLRLTLGKYFSARDSSGATRDGADEFVLDLVRRAASQQRQWRKILCPNVPGGQEVGMSREPDITVIPDSPHAWQEPKVELPTRTMTRKYNNE